MTVAAAPAQALAALAEARARFLQVVADCAQTTLVDNLDHLFHPFGHELPDPAGAGARLAEQLDILDRCEVLWQRLGDEKSRELLLRFLAYKALGPAHVRLQLEPEPYRKTVQQMHTVAVRQAGVLGLPGLPHEWQAHLYDLEPLGLPVRVIGAPLPLASTYGFSQYAYREQSVPARPQPEGVALDVGGCWGDTALWLALSMGPGSRVHTFEPTPKNRTLLQRNVELNPALAPRITVHDAPLAARAGETVWIADALAAGARIEPAPGEGAVELRTDTIDDFVARGEIERVDFLKVDVEGADLGVLEGAARTIAEQRPRLALACYHKPDDLVTLPDFVDSLGVEYRWYLQCSTMTDIDTVAFGVPAEPNA